MPAFNTNLFKLSSPDYLCTHAHQAVEVCEKLTSHETTRQESLLKAYQKLKGSSKSAAAGAKSMAQAASDDTNSNKLDYFLLSQQVNALCSQMEDCGIPAAQ